MGLQTDWDLWHAQRALARTRPSDPGLPRGRGER